MTNYNAQQALELIRKIHLDPLSPEEQRYFIEHWSEEYNLFKSRQDLDNAGAFTAATDVIHKTTIDMVRYKGNALVNTTLGREMINHKIEERLRAGETLEDIIRSI